VALGEMRQGHQRLFKARQRLPVGQAGSWLPITGRLPYSTWELQLPNTEEVKS
jgi:hypothetical protein